MAEAPSLRISTREIAPSGIEFRSTDLPLAPCVAMRRPFNSTRVLDGPRPRSEANEAPPLTRSASAPNTLLPEVMLSAPVPLADRVRTNCSVDVMPCFSIWSNVMTCTGNAPSLATRLMLLPVTSTRCIAGAAASCAITGPTTPINATNCASFFNFTGLLLVGQSKLELSSQAVFSRRNCLSRSTFFYDICA